MEKTKIDGFEVVTKLFLVFCVFILNSAIVHLCWNFVELGHNISLLQSMALVIMFNLLLRGSGFNLRKE